MQAMTEFHVTRRGKRFACSFVLHDGLLGPPVATNRYEGDSPQEAIAKALEGVQAALEERAAEYWEGR